MAACYGDESFVLNVNFLEAKNLDVIVDDFKTWLRTEAKRRGFRRPQGRKAALPWHLLKNLAALRLGRHLQFNAAQDLLKAISKNDSEPCKVLPIFSEANKWTAARKDAVQLLKKQET